MKITLTHRGWFGICPVYFDDPYSDHPFIEPRHPWFEFLFDISEHIFNAIHWCQELVDPYADLWYPITITGELDPFIELEVDEAENV